MNDETQEDRMDAAIREAARGYNTPPSTPSDEMWARIQARRVARPAIQIQPARARWGWMMVAAAAVLFAGIGIGYVARGGTSGGTAQQQLASRPTPSTAPEASTTPSATHDSEPTSTPFEAAPRGRVASTQRTGHDAGRGLRGDARGAPSDVAPDLAYRLAVVEHLARTEALLTSFRSEARSGTVDAQVSNWARDLLRTTRLMESSTETQDPTMRRLLGDLELVLVQIAQYSSTAQGQQRGEELDFIEQSIDRRGVIPKLRAAIPPGMIPAGT